MPEIPPQVQVVVIGGGIAGSALAWNLAEHGIDCLVLERQPRYRDRVRGEVLNCWGILEARALGIERALHDAGGNYAPRFIGYDDTVEPEIAESRALDVSTMIPGVPGVLTVGHPELCQALDEGARRHGAVVAKGITLIDAKPGEPHGRTIFRDHAGTTHEVSSRLIVGADGRSSTTRRLLGLPMTQTAPNSLGGGLLVDGLHDWRLDTTWIGTEADLLYFIYPRPNGRARLYLLHAPQQRNRFSGPLAARDFIRAYQRLTCVPWAAQLFASMRPASSSTPCAFFPMNDSHCERITVPGAVLIGDAAGWSDPIIGQGLCIALRDAHLVADALRGQRHWDESMFTPYIDERRVRMSRLLTSGRLRSAMGLTFTPEGRSRRRAYARTWPTDPVLAGSRLATFKGPHNVPAESFAESTIEFLLNLS